MDATKPPVTSSPGGQEACSKGTTQGREAGSRECTGQGDSWMGGLMSAFAELKSELESIDQWRERLADFGVIDTGPLLDEPLGFALESLRGWTEYYRRLVEKAEKERIG